MPWSRATCRPMPWWRECPRAWCGCVRCRAGCASSKGFAWCGQPHHDRGRPHLRTPASRIGTGPAKAEAGAMRTQRNTTRSQTNPNLAARVGRWSVQHRRKAILGWLAFVFVSLVVGFNLVPQKNLENGEGMPGESGKAGQVVKGAYPDKAAEQVLVQSKSLRASDSQFKA